MTRIEFAEKIIAVVESRGGYVFGGYVRDQVRRQFLGASMTDVNWSFNDVDVYVPKCEFATIFRDICSVLNCRGRSLRAPQLYGVRDIVRNKYEIQSPDFSVALTIDVVTSEEESNPFREDADVDVNYLYRMNGVIYASSASGTTVRVIYEHIRDREYVASDAVASHRIAKIECKGYKRVGVSGVCPECHGVGEIDFGFYKRTCACKLK